MNQAVASEDSTRFRDDDEQASGRTEWSTRLAWAALGIAVTAMVVLLVHVGRGTTWFFDEWDWVLQRRSGGIDTVLRDHNGHLNAIPVLVYQLWWKAFGLEHYTGLRVLTALLHAGVCLTLFAFLRRRLQSWLALGAVLALLVLGYGYHDLIWPFQMQYLGPLLAGLVALLAADRRSSGRDVVAAIALTVAIACSGLGLMFVAAFAVRYALRRSTWRQLWIPAAPLVVYGVWYLGYGVSQAKSSNTHLVPAYVARAGAAAAGALVGTELDLAAWIVGALLLLAVVVTCAWRRRISPELAGALVLPWSFWILTALSRADLGEPAASRYLYPGAVFILVVLGELVHDPTWPRTTRSRWLGASALVVVLVFAVVGGISELRRGAESMREVSNAVRAELAAVELARGHVAPDFRPDPVRAPQVSAGPYLAAVRDLGSPAFAPATLATRPEGERTLADGVLRTAVRARVTPTSAPTGSCRVVDRTTTLTDPPAQFVVWASPGAPVAVSARVFAGSDAGATIGSVAPGAVGLVHVPKLDGRPWRVVVASDAPFRVCPAG